MIAKETVLVAHLAFFMCSNLHGQHSFSYDQPAKDWNEALPVGNGRLGAMVFGDPTRERIQLNEDSVWAGPGESVVDAKGTPEDLAALRQLIRDGDYQAADRFIVRSFSRGSIQRAHQTLGDLHLDWQGDGADVSDYHRTLDLETALITSTWKRDDTRYTQTVFCSNPDEALFIHLKAEGPKTLDCDVRLDRPADQGLVTHQTSALDGTTLSMTGQVTQRKGRINGTPTPDMKGVRFEARLRAETEEGACSANGAVLQIRSAREVWMRLTATTDFWPQTTRAAHRRATAPSHFTPRGANPAVSSTITQAHEISQSTHIADHQGLYNRCRLNLPVADQANSLTTGQRFAKLTPDHTDPILEALLFHYGRYLLIASSRANGNPANLQGLWNSHIDPPWNNDYHLNINLQMNYWPAEVTHLSETHIPVFSWMQELARRGAITARKQYGMRGWVAHHASELRAPATMKAAQPYWGAWIHGGGWMCQHVWTHFDYTRDKYFLRETGYPLLAGHARFYLDWLIEEDGKWISSPETSPENSFITPAGKRAAVCAKAAMGQQIIHEVLVNTLAAAGVLQIDDELTREIEQVLPKLDSGLHVGPDGRLLEWDKPYKEAEPGHRHLSHLYAFHPGNTITLEKTPKLMEAVKQSIAFREKSGSIGIGWSRAWAVNIYARLRNGNGAHHHLHEMLRTQTLNNGFNSVFGRSRPVFQIEANLGATAGVAEMLLQSHGDQIHLLPALPDAWPKGSITGLRARGGHTIDLVWEDGKLARAVISPGPGPLNPICIQGRQAHRDPRVTVTPNIRANSNPAVPLAAILSF